MYKPSFQNLLTPEYSSIRRAKIYIWIIEFENIGMGDVVWRGK